MNVRGKHYKKKRAVKRGHGQKRQEIRTAGEAFSGAARAETTPCGFLRRERQRRLTRIHAYIQIYIYICIYTYIYIYIYTVKSR